MNILSKKVPTMKRVSIQTIMILAFAGFSQPIFEIGSMVESERAEKRG